MAYIPNPSDASEPLATIDSSTAAAEFRALKGRVNSVAASIGIGGIASMDKNMIINGDFLIDQLNETAGSYTNAGAGNVLTADGFSTSAVGAGTLTAQVVTDPSNVAANSIKLVATVADAALAATDAYVFFQAIEGFRTRRLAYGTAGAASAVLSFYVEGLPAGTYSIAIQNSAHDRSYLNSFGVAGTAKQKIEIVIPGDITGTWLYTSGGGIYIYIALGVGSNFLNAAGNTWLAGNYLCLNGMTNFMAVLNNTVYITQMQFEVGTVATDFETKNIEERFLECQRYYWKSFPVGTVVDNGQGLVGSINYIAVLATAIGNGLYVPWKTIMRAIPAITSYNPSAANAAWRNQSIGADSGAFTAVNASQKGVLAVNAQVGGDGVTNIMSVHITANARLS